MKIVRFEEEHHLAWNEFVNRRPEGTFFHRAEWIKITRSYYGFPSFSFLVMAGDEIEAIVPLFLCRSPFLGRCLIPSPLCGRQNLCLRTPDAEEPVWEELERLLEETGARFVEMRFDSGHERRGLPTSREHLLQPLFLEENQEKQWEKLKSSVRNKIRQAEKYNLETSGGKEEYFPAFYRLYASNMRDFAYPLLGKKLFRLLMEEFAEIMEFFVLKNEGTVLASLINFYFKDTVTNLWGVSSKKHLNLRINNYLYWSALKKAIADGYRIFDFGRARKNSGVARFKQQWGTADIPLSYQYLSHQKIRLPSVEETREKYRLPMLLWRHLPLWGTRLLGPPLGKLMPL